MTPDIPNITTFFQESGIHLIFKVLVLTLLFVFIIFNLIVVTRIKTLNRTLSLTAAHASAFIQIAAAIILFASISLFIITLVIV